MDKDDIKELNGAFGERIPENDNTLFFNLKKKPEKIDSGSGSVPKSNCK